MTLSFFKSLTGAALVAGFMATGFAIPAALAARTDVVLGVRLEPPHLDPTAGAAAAIDEIVFINVFEGLTQVDRDGSVKAALAKGWTISDDGLTYTFTLQSGVTFHDGTPMTAADVVYSFDRSRGEDSVNAKKEKFEPIDTMTAADDTTVEIVLKRPTGDFLFNLGTGDMVIVGEESADTNKSEPVGTGPFKFARWVKGDRVELERNPDYWGEAAKLEKATFKVVNDTAAQLSSLLAGDVDGYPIFSATENLPQLEADNRFTVVVGSTEGETIMTTNNAAEPFSDVRVRQALAHAINKQAIVDGAMFGYGTVIGTHFAPHHPAYLDLTGKYAYDPEKAKALLAEAGYPNGFKTTLKLPPPNYARRGGEIIAADLKKVGIEAELIPLEWAQWLEQVFRGKDYDLTIVSHTEALDIGIYAKEGYYFNYANTALNDVIANLNATTDTDARYSLMKEAQEIIANDAVNVYLFQLAKTGVWNAKLKGLWENAPVQANDLTGVYWED